MIDSTMPPSRSCTTWTWLEGITCPSPLVTKGTLARSVHHTPARRTPMMANSSRLVEKRGPRTTAALRSDMKGASLSLKPAIAALPAR